MLPFPTDLNIPNAVPPYMELSSQPLFHIEASYHFTAQPVVITSIRNQSCVENCSEVPIPFTNVWKPYFGYIGWDGKCNNDFPERIHAYLADSVCREFSDDRRTWWMYAECTEEKQVLRECQDSDCSDCVDAAPIDNCSNGGDYNTMCIFPTDWEAEKNAESATIEPQQYTTIVFITIFILILAITLGAISKIRVSTRKTAAATKYKILPQ